MLIIPGLDTARQDGLPKRAGLSVYSVMDVSNAWGEMPEDPHNLVLDRVREEMAGPGVTSS